MNITSEQDKQMLREGGRRLGELLAAVCARIEPGTDTKALDDFVRREIARLGDTPAFLNYTPHGAARPYPAAMCVSVNNEVVHGIPNEDTKILRDGDIVTVDIGLVHKEYVVDAARTAMVGSVDEVGKKLVTASREALTVALRTARTGNTTGDIGHAVESIADRYGFSTPRELGGHGVGERVHEEPFIPNVGKPGSGEVLEEGMVLAIEPIVLERKGGVKLLPDGYTYVTKDGGRAAQFEETVIVTNDEPEILTNN